MKHILGSSMLALSLLVATTSTSYAEHSQVILGEISGAGTGCPGGRGIRADLVGQELVISFDRVEAQPSQGVQMERSACNIALPVSVGQGRKLVVEKVDLLGQVDLSRKTKASISNEVFVAGQRGPLLEWKLQAKNAVRQEVRLTGRSQISSKCGQDLNLRANTSVIVNRGKRASGNIAKVSQLRLKLAVASCK